MCDLKQTEWGAVLVRKGSNPTSVRAQQTIFHSVSYNLLVFFQPTVLKKINITTKSHLSCSTKLDLAYSQVTCPIFTGLDHWMLDNTVEKNTHMPLHRR